MISLLFKSSRANKAIPSDTCIDIGLSLLFSDEVIDIMSSSPSGEDISIRQEMFSELLESPTLCEELFQLEQTLRVAAKLYTSQNRAVCEAVDVYIFPHVFDFVSQFAEKASALDAKCGVLCKFREELAKFCSDERFLEAKKRLPEVKNALSGASEFFIKTGAEGAKLQKQNDTDITSDLMECARELGIELKKRDVGEMLLQKGIAEAIQKANPEAFVLAGEFYRDFRTLVNGEIFERLNELRFILEITEFTKNAKKSGIPYSFPKISDSKILDLKNVYDITLLKKQGTVIVPNDASFTPSEPFFYLTGANGGGKTTYLRAVGCAVMLFLAGAPVFCDGGECPVFDSVLTHFPRDERFEGSGRFFDEIRRVDAILSLQKGNSLILLNETYATTGEDKAREYTDKLAKELYKSGSFGFYITHQHDVREAEIPFLGVVVDSDDSNRRTYRIEKRRLPPKSFARDILEKYGLTKDLLFLKKK